MTALLTESRKGHYGSNYIYAYSHKTDKLVQLESTLEYYHFLVVEMDYTIKSYTVHPDKIRLVSEDGKQEGSIFDMLVYKVDSQREYREIKYTNDLEKERTKTQLRIQREWCEHNGFVHKLVTEKDLILSPDYINNVAFFYYRLGGLECENRVSHMAILHSIEDAGTITVRDLTEYGYDIDRVYTSLAYLYSVGEITMDLRGKIDYDLEVSYRA